MTANIPIITTPAVATICTLALLPASLIADTDAKSEKGISETYKKRLAIDDCSVPVGNVLTFQMTGTSIINGNKSRKSIFLSFLILNARIQINIKTTIAIMTFGSIMDICHFSG